MIKLTTAMISLAMNAAMATQDWVDNEPIKARLDDPAVLTEFRPWAPKTKVWGVCYRSELGYWTTTLAVDTGLPDSEGAVFEWVYELYSFDQSAWLDAESERGPVDRVDEWFYGDTIGPLIRDVVVNQERLRLRRWEEGIDPADELDNVEDDLFLPREPWIRLTRRLINRGCRDPHVLASGAYLGDKTAAKLLTPNAVEMNARKVGWVLRMPVVIFKRNGYSTKLRLNYDGTWEFITVDILEGQ